MSLGLEWGLSGSWPAGGESFCRVELLETNSALTALRAGRKASFVPTMGALHEGHAELIRRGVALAHERGYAGGCVVSIFVNPTQFNDPKDLERYPRTLGADLELCRRCGAAAVYAPDVREVYPEGQSLRAPLPAVATRPGLEDARRPGHFAGVCQVVSRLFELISPAAALFGEKDWQQLQVVRAMTAEQGRMIEIVSVPTVRESDGLAMSSRNRFLSPHDRAQGLSLWRALQAGQRARSPEQAETLMRQVLLEAGVEPEYAVVREATSLEPAPARPGVRHRALIAARVGAVRLLDNAPWGP